MKLPTHSVSKWLIRILAVALVLPGISAFSSSGPTLLRYRVTVQNLAAGQPLSPPVAATHRGGVRVFQAGRFASPQLEAIAEDGNQTPMFNLLDSSSRVTQAVDVGMPLTPSGQVVASFTDAVSFEIMAYPGDRLSLATMLICSNDGFTGLDRARLPRKGAFVYWMQGYDAGTENNTEQSGDIVDPCSALGPAGLSGDPNGNQNAAVDTDPRQPIQLHPGILGGGDLDPAQHGWNGPIAKVTITRLSDQADRFLSFPAGAGEVPPAATRAEGRAAFELDASGDRLYFALSAFHIDQVAQAHIHMGAPNQNGPVVAFLYGPTSPTGTVNGRLSRGVITQGDLLGPLAGDFAAFVTALRDGDLYVNVHTSSYPGGEIRGQIGAANH